MAKFDPPYANAADFRFPTNDEQLGGFPCGPADRELFNGLFRRLEAEVGEVINHAGITQTNEDLTQLRQAIVALIDAATGGGDPSIYLLMAQARARLPIFPEVQNVDGRINITAPTTGTIRVPGGVVFQHRGIWPVTTVQEDFPTTASKTYHLRWTPNDGFQLRDLSDPVYNPSTLAETNVAFDSGYDDMLVARVITNSSNLATITNLANKPRLMFAQQTGRVTDNIIFEFPSDGYGNNSARRVFTFDYNFARTPVITSINAMLGASNPGPQGYGIHGAANAVYNKTVNRTFTRFTVTTDWNQTTPAASGFYAEVDFQTMV